MTCPTPCDPDCEAPCHEAHEPYWKRTHDPATCPPECPVTDWFGKRHDAPVYDDGAEVPVPVGMACWYCKERIEEGDDGFQLPALMDVPRFDPPEYGPANYHRWCLFRMILGPGLSDAALHKEYGGR